MGEGWAIASWLLPLRGHGDERVKSGSCMGGKCGGGRGLGEGPIWSNGLFPPNVLKHVSPQ